MLVRRRQARVSGVVKCEVWRVASPSRRIRQRRWQIEPGMPPPVGRQQDSSIPTMATNLLAWAVTRAAKSHICLTTGPICRATRLQSGNLAGGEIEPLMNLNLIYLAGVFTWMFQRVVLPAASATFFTHWTVTSVASRLVVLMRPKIAYFEKKRKEERESERKKDGNDVFLV